MIIEAMTAVEGTITSYMTRIVETVEVVAIE